ncbi:ADP-ribose pyrophosphatase YjhB, NUDIX family [Streptomyces sp. Termitarium-T10T-6]|nr:ADP-ribose pyrophosphatase YjhB, NUDIX family [Streptomyces sp. Termitarium-T10T-6]
MRGPWLLIRFEEDGGPLYEIPGGGVEEGETPEEAVLRELGEETGLGGTVGPRIARVWKDGRHEHYFLVSATGEVGPPETLDNYGGTPVWVPVDRLPATPLVAPAALLAHRALAPDGVAGAPGGAGRLHHGAGAGVRVVRGRPRGRREAWIRQRTLRHA